MHQLLKIRADILRHFETSTVREAHLVGADNRDRFAQYETAMLLVADTGEALLAHRQRDFSPSWALARIELYGALQAVVIQQDALIELALALGAPRPVPGPAWKAVRDLRTVVAGHPAKKDSGRPAPLRAIMGRQPQSYRELTYELWDAASGKVTHPQVDLAAMMTAYEVEACEALDAILRHMRTAWPIAA